MESSATPLSELVIFSFTHGRSFNADSDSTAANCNLSSKSCGLSSLTLKMEALQTFKTSGTSSPMTQHYIPEDLHLQKHHCKNLKSHKLELVLLMQLLLAKGHNFTTTISN
jgi:hypothetical protein